jgi:dihydrofolate reductase
MGKVIVSEFVSLDGVMEDPGGSEGTPHGGWTVPYWCDEIGAFKGTELSDADALLLGRVTYDGFAAAWPSMGGDEFGDRMNGIAKYVVTSSGDGLTWNNSHRLDGDAATAVADLKQRLDGDLLVGGSAKLAQSLAAAGLVDGYRLVVYPVALGSGKRVFGDAGSLQKLVLTSQSPTSSGAVLLTYDVE